MVKPTRSRRVARKNKRERRPARASAPHQHDVEVNAEQGWHEFLHTQTPHQQTTQLQGLHLSSVQRQALALEIARTQGNRSLSNLIQPASDQAQSKLNERIQRRPAPVQAGANPGGRGPGQIQNGQERPYNVSGTTLAQVSTQLHRFAGFAAQTYAAITMQGRVAPERGPDGTYSVRVQWIIPQVIVDLPRWTGYDAACPAAQQEWDRFMQQTRQHEQEAHVNEAYAMVSQLPETDVVLTGRNRREVTAKLHAKHQELAVRLQALHDGCDHGVSIDALLHPERGHC